MLAEFAIGMLDPITQQQVKAHLSDGCEECREQLQEITETWAALPGFLPDVAPPDSIKRELFARIRASETVSLTPEAEPVLLTAQRADSPLAKPYLAILPYVAASLVGIMAGYWFVNSEARNPDWANQYQLNISNAKRLFGKERVYLATLQFPKEQPERYCQLVWDGTAKQVHCYAFGLGELTSGSVFRLWFVTAEDEWQAVADLGVQPDGVCTAAAPWPPLTNKWSRAVVTMEPEGRSSTSAKPQGTIQLRGKFN